MGILLASVANTLFLTDHGDRVLDNCAMNVQLNSAVVNYQAVVQVRELDWVNSWPPMPIQKSLSGRRYSWTSSEIEEVESASLLVAADVIYSEDLTDALFSTLRSIMSQGPKKGCTYILRDDDGDLLPTESLENEEAQEESSTQQSETSNENVMNV